MKDEILFSSPYEYPDLSRETTETGRVYIAGEERLASVTTILSKTKQENDNLQKWIERVGEEEAERIRNEAAARGTEMHELLERQLVEGSIWDYYPETADQKRAYKMACTIMDQGFPSIDQVYGCEVPLYYPGKYAGTADVIGKHLGEEAIMDFKQTNTPKRRRSYVWDYFQQLAAYALAHNEVYGTEIRKGVIMMCSVDCFYQEFVLEGREFERAADAWNTRVEKFILLQTKHQKDSEAQVSQTSQISALEQPVPEKVNQEEDH